MKRITRLMAVFLIPVLLCLTATSIAAPKPKRITLGFPAPTLDHEWWVTCTTYAKQAAAELGIDLIVTDAQDSEIKQIEDVSTLLARGVDGLVVSCMVSAVGPRILEMAKARGVPVVFFDRAPDARSKDWPGTYLSFVSPNSVDAAYKVGKYLFEVEKVKNVVRIQGMLGSASQVERDQGMDKALKEHPNVKELGKQPADWNQEKGQRIMADFLAAHPEIDGVWAANDAMALGALRAVEAAGRRGKVKIAAMDLSKTALESILSDSGFVLTIGGHWISGAYGVIALFDHLNGIPLKEDFIEFDMVAGDTGNAATMLREVYQSEFMKGQMRELSKFYKPELINTPYRDIFQLSNFIKAN